MILNVILCKYAGSIVPIGEHDEERAEYLGIKQRLSAEMEGARKLATDVLQRAMTRLRALKQKLAGRTAKSEKLGASSSTPAAPGKTGVKEEREEFEVFTLVRTVQTIDLAFRCIAHEVDSVNGLESTVIPD